MPLMIPIEKVPPVNDPYKSLTVVNPMDEDFVKEFKPAGKPQQIIVVPANGSYDGTEPVVRFLAGHLAKRLVRYKRLKELEKLAKQLGPLGQEQAVYKKAANKAYDAKNINELADLLVVEPRADLDEALKKASKNKDIAAIKKSSDEVLATKEEVLEGIGDSAPRLESDKGPEGESLDAIKSKVKDKGLSEKEEAPVDE